MSHMLNKALILCRTAFRTNIIYGPATKLTHVKTCYQFTNRTNIRAEKQFKRIDNISDDYKLVFRDNRKLTLMLSFTYHSAWIGIIATLISAGYIILRDPPQEEEILEDVFNEPFKVVGDVGKLIGACGGLIICSVIIYVSRMIPLRIYHNHKEKLYKVVFISIIGKRKVVTFGEGTAVQKYKNRYFSDLFDINGHTILLNEEDFPVPFIREQMICKSK